MYRFHPDLGERRVAMGVVTTTVSGVGTGLEPDKDLTTASCTQAGR